ncbi:DUF6183 family protein [Streptomyces mirabilis]|uniref:DUF6183 family protein n=1 Tax=Streptomyces mirabilis TaxID=68239 RepID=UPI003715847D
MHGRPAAGAEGGSRRSAVRRRPCELDELRTCLFQELVLRGVDIDTFPALRSWPLVRHGWHPLAWLPVHRRDFEANADFPSRSIRGSANGVPSRLPDEGRISLLNYGAGSELSRQSWVAGPAHGSAGNCPCPAGEWDCGG